MSQLNEMFDGLDGAIVDSKRPKLDEGQYILEIQCTKQGKGYNSGPNFVIEAKIVECLTPALAAKFPAGKEVSCTINRLTDRKEENRNLALGNLKQFLAAAFSDFDFSRLGAGLPAGKNFIDENSEQKWTQLAMLCVKNESLLAGARVRVQVDKLATKGGFEFFKHSYRALNAPAGQAA